MPPPRVTVLLPVYRAEAYLREAVDSILGQTYGDFTLLAVEDGSPDRSAEVLESYRDPRLRVVRHARNEGLIASLNEGLDLAEGDYLARMDADDVAHPDRLRRQVEWLDAHPAVAVLGTEARNFGAGTSTWRVPRTPEEVRARLLFGNVLAHSTVMLRPAVLRREGLRYDPEYPHAEDYALWSAVAARADVANLPERLLRVRVHEGSTSAVHREVHHRTVRRIRAEALARAGVAAGPADLELHERVVSGEFDASDALLADAERWLATLRAAGPRLRCEAALAREVGYRWARTCRRASRTLGIRALRRFRASALARDARPVQRAEVVLGALATAIGGARGRSRGAV